MAPIFTIVDPALSSLRGHMLLQAASLDEAFKAAGCETEIVSHRDLPDHPLLAGRTVRRHFSVSPYLSVDPDPVSGRTNQFNALVPVLRDEIGALVEPSDGRPRHLIFPTVNLYVLAGIAAVAQQSLSSMSDATRTIHALLHLECGVFMNEKNAIAVSDTLQAKLWRDAFEALSPFETVKLRAVSREMADLYSFVAGRPVPAIAPFHALRIDTGTRRPEPRLAGERTKVLLYAGQASVKKGFLRLGPLTDILLERLPGTEFVVQVYDADDDHLAPVAARLRELAKAQPRLTLVEGFLSDGALDDLLSGGGVALIGHQRRQYAGKTSGLLWDAIARGQIIVAPAGTWLSRECAVYGAPCVAFEKEGPEAVAEAVVKAVGKAPKLAAQALAASRVFAERAGPASLMREMLGSRVQPQVGGARAS